MARLLRLAGGTEPVDGAAPPVARGGVPILLVHCSGPRDVWPVRSAGAALPHRPAATSPVDPQLTAFERALEGLAQLAEGQRDLARREMPQKIRGLPAGVQLRAWELLIRKIPSADPRTGEPHPRQFVYDALQDLPADLRSRVALRLMEVFRSRTDLDLLLSATLVKANPETPRAEVAAVLKVAELHYQIAMRDRQGTS